MAVNPNILVPVTDAIIETSWGIDVADTLNWVYDNKLSLTGGTVTGSLFAPYVFATEAQWEGGGSGAAFTRRDYVDGRRARQTAVSITGSNVPAGTTALAGIATLTSSTVVYAWSVQWSYFLSGHSTGSEYRVRMINASTGSLLMVSGYDHYHAGESHSGAVTAHFGTIGGASEVYIGFQLEIVTAFANTNIAGQAVCIGTPA